MSTTVRIGLIYGIAAVVVFVAGLVLDSGLVMLLAALLVVVGFLHAFRGRAVQIEHGQAEAEASVRDGNADPERHSF